MKAHSLEDVKKAVDSEMVLRLENERLKESLESIANMPALDALEARMILAQATVMHWQRLRARSEIACEKMAEVAVAWEVR